MCVYSMIVDSKTDDWFRRYWPEHNPLPPYQFPPPKEGPSLPTQDELDEFKRLLERAREYDRENNQPDCPEEEKRKLLKEMAKQLGVEIEFV